MRARSAGTPVASRSRGYKQVGHGEVLDYDGPERKGRPPPPRLHTSWTATTDVDHGSSRRSTSNSRRPRPHRHRQTPATNIISGAYRIHYGGAGTSLTGFFPLPRDTYYQDCQMKAENAAVKELTPTAHSNGGGGWGHSKIGMVRCQEPEDWPCVVDLQEPTMRSMRRLRRPRPDATR